MIQQSLFLSSTQSPVVARSVFCDEAIQTTFNGLLRRKKRSSQRRRTELFYLIFIIICLLSNTALAIQHPKKTTHYAHQKSISHHKKRPMKQIRKQHKKRKSLKKTKPIKKSKPLKKNKLLKKTKRQKTASKKIIAATMHLQPNVPSRLPAYVLNTTEKKLISYIKQIISHLHYSKYQFGGTHLDNKKGIYVIDCSSYVDHILKSVYPQAFSQLSEWSQTNKPTTEDFYHYFLQLHHPDLMHWSSVSDVKELRPGDVLVIRYQNKKGQERGGHVMLVMDKPLIINHEVAVRVTDSAGGGHSKDTRPAHASGVGIGTLLLKTDGTMSRPMAFAWKIGSKWETRASFAMGRPLSPEQMPS